MDFCNDCGELSSILHDDGFTIRCSACCLAGLKDGNCDNTILSDGRDNGGFIVFVSEDGDTVVIPPLYALPEEAAVAVAACA